MKKISILSILLFLGAAQMHSISNNVDLLMVLAYKNAQIFNDAILSDNDDVNAVILLQAMKDSIDFDKSAKAQLASTKPGMFSAGKLLDPAKIKQQIDALEDRIETLNRHIKAFEKNGVTAVEKPKVDARRRERRDAKEQLALLQQEQKDLAINAASNAEAAATLQKLIEQNALAFEHSLETYIANFGQIYSDKINDKVMHVISSKYSRDMAITPKEYNQLVATLNNAVPQFDAVANITIENHEISHDVKVSEILAFIKNKPLSSSSYSSYAQYAAVGLAVAGVAIGAVAINNYRQGKDLTDLSDVQAAYDAALTSTNDTIKSLWNMMGFTTNAEITDAIAASAEQSETAANESLFGRLANATSSVGAQLSNLKSSLGGQLPSWGYQQADAN